MVKTRRTLLFLQPDREYLDERKGRSTFFIFLIDWINILSITGRPRRHWIKNKSGALVFFFNWWKMVLFVKLFIDVPDKTNTRLSHTCSLYYSCDKPIHYPSVLFKILPVWTTFDTVPCFNTSMILLSGYINLSVFKKNNYISLK